MACFLHMLLPRLLRLECCWAPWAEVARFPCVAGLRRMFFAFGLILEYFFAVVAPCWSFRHDHRCRLQMTWNEHCLEELSDVTV